MEDSQRYQHRKLGALLVATAAIIWPISSSLSVLIQWNSWAEAIVRNVLVGALLLLGLKWRGILRPSFTPLFLCICGLIGASNIAFLAGVEFSTVSNGVLLYSTFPAITLVIDCILQRRLPTTIETLLSVLAFGGAYLVMGWDAEHLHVLGACCSIGAALAWALVLQFGGKFMNIAGMLNATAYGNLLMGILSLPALYWISPPAPSVSDIDGILAVAIITTFTFVPLCAGVGKIEPHFGALIQLVEIPAALIMGYLANHEAITPTKCLGAALILTAAAIAALYQPRTNQEVTASQDLLPQQKVE